ncbi:hypothetical protein AWB80_03088 [Caballeronia pedi]|uniref:Uncharacterized protein n=1 Tax=Caballeronia pedi TaxID=1777141 RepID=A0A158B793_9BURK|nr:hypothetical protein [Caballeronia pedi]SAK65616.1 hypothetical protein AWB80_03088 [Caballeronia pedi]
MNCKPGDLAMIVKAPTAPGHIGKIVEVLGDLEADPTYGPCWVCRTREPVSTIRSGFITDPHIPDDWLRPVSGLPLDNDLPAEVNLPEAFKLALGIEMRAWA